MTQVWSTALPRSAADDGDQDDHDRPDEIEVGPETGTPKTWSMSIELRQQRRNDQHEPQRRYGHKAPGELPVVSRLRHGLPPHPQLTPRDRPGLSARCRTVPDHGRSAPPQPALCSVQHGTGRPATSSKTAGASASAECAARSIRRIGGTETVHAFTGRAADARRIRDRAACRDGAPAADRAPGVEPQGAALARVLRRHHTLTGPQPGRVALVTAGTSMQATRLSRCPSDSAHVAP